MTADRTAPSNGEHVCANCRWWGEPYEYDPELNDCNNPWTESYLNGFLATPPDFGCNQWEARNDTELRTRDG